MPREKQTRKKISRRSPPIKRKRFFVRLLLIGLGLFLVAGFLVYSVVSYKNSEEAEAGFFVCNKENTECLLSQHIHAEIDVTRCGEKIIFPRETGRTDMQHTHKETNTIHYHARHRVDPTTRLPIDGNPVTLKGFLEQMNFDIPLSCPGKETAGVVVAINESIMIQGLEVPWKDGDKITVEIK